MVTAGDVRRGFGFYQPFQPQINIFIWKHTATAVRSGYSEGTGTLGIICLLFAYSVVVYSPTKCMWHPDEWGHFLSLPLMKMEWMKKVCGEFCSTFVYHWLRPSLAWAQTECGDAGHQAETFWSLSFASTFYLFYLSSWHTNFNFVSSWEFNLLNVYSIG